MDACALLAAARNEKGADIVVDIYNKTSKGTANLFLNKINLLEVYYDFYRYKGKDYADNFVNTIKRSEVQICEFDEIIFTHAGRLKATYKISLADSIALAQAIVLKGSLLTCDHHEFDVIEGKEPLKFHWIR
ncbi:MAG: PIN domain-containing protein [Defluviitaleaceae bacterium]|nr:PIN domain-containing protein [Defluviitaleaceae bacterium]